MADRPQDPSDVSDDEWVFIAPYLLLAKEDAKQRKLEVVKLPDATRGFVLLPRRWVVERSFAWKSRFRRLVCDYERTLTTLAEVHDVAFACLELQRARPLLPTVHNSL